MVKIGFIGAGVVGTALGMLLKDKEGFQLSGYYSRSFSSARRAAAQTDSPAYEKAESLLGAAEVVFITTNDDAIAPVVRDLVERDLLTPLHTLVHCSGSLTLAVLEPAARLGVGVLSVHPLQSCASVEQALDNIPGSVFSIEGAEAVRALGEKIVAALGGEHFFIEGEKKALYHAAAVVASNYLVTLLGLSKQLMLAAGMPKQQVFPALYPLIQGTLKNIRTLDIPQALTGPLARGDSSTIEDHLQAMQDNISEAIPFYKCLGLETVPLALEKGTLGEEKALLIRELLIGSENM